MDTITRRYRGEWQSFEVLTRTEADQKGLLYADWRVARPGEWAASDDGFVARCLAVRVMTDQGGRVKRLVTLPYGRAWVTGSGKLLYEARRATRNWSGTSARTWQEQEARRSRTRNAVRLYARQQLNGTVNFDEIGRIYRSDQRIPAATFKRLLRQERISRMVEEETRKLLEKGGISVEKTLADLEELLRMAKEEKDRKTMLEVITRLMAMHGLIQKRW